MSKVNNRGNNGNNRDRHLFSLCIILKEDFSIFFSLFKMDRSETKILT